MTARTLYSLVASATTNNQEDNLDQDDYRDIAENFSDPLAECLRRIHGGQDSVDAALRRYEVEHGIA